MYRLSGAELKVVERAREIARSDIAPHAARVDADGVFPEEAMKALADAGFLGLPVGAEFGGMGQSMRVACAVLEEVSRACASTAMVYLMHLCGLACYAVAPGNARAELRAAAQGRHLSTLAWSEKGSRSHFWAPVSRAQGSDGSVTLDAEKSWVTSAGIADGYVVSTQQPSAVGPTDTTLYLVRKGDPGVSVAGSWDGLGMRGNASAPMTLKDVALGTERELSAPGAGFETMLGVVLPWFQVGSAAVAVGISEAAVDATQRHLTAGRFEHMDSKLADLPNLRARLAQMRIETDRSRAHLVSVIDSVEDPGPATQLMVLGIKAAATETAVSVTDSGMRACGGAAFSKYLGLERMFRDARAAIVMAPTTDHAHDFIGRVLCGMELF